MRANKIVSMLILVCFLFNTIVSDLAFGLATPSGLNDIVGIQHKDMGRIKLALEEQLVALIHPGLPVNIGTFQTILKERNVRERTVFQPADMQFFFHETKLTNAGLCVMCRLNDRYGLRTYYATFSLQKDENDGFPINIYTEEQYKGTAGFMKGMPQIRPEDKQAIARYIQHEKGVDAVIAYAHKQGLAKELAPTQFDYRNFVERLLSEIGIKVTNPEGLLPIQDRKFYLVKLTKEIQGMISDNPTAIIDAEGKVHAVTYFAHSSNNAIHIFVPEATFETLMTSDFKAGQTAAYREASREVAAKLTYEIGVTLGFPVTVDSDGNLWNELNRRVVANSDQRKAFRVNPLEVAVVNLDNVKVRDYAAGQVLPSVNPTTTEAWKSLEADLKDIRQVSLSDLFKNDPERAQHLNEEFASGNAQMYVDYSKNRVNSNIMTHLIQLASQTKLAEAIRQMFSGGKINATENRSVLHVALRMPRNQSLVVDGSDVIPDVHRVLDHMKQFSEAINSGEWKGYTGKPITDIVNIGIGGSDLGPVMVTEALKPYATGKINVHFVSNVDGTDITEKVIKRLNPETTLFMIASKTFTTQETMTNAQTARQWFLSHAKDENAIKKHFVAISTNKKEVEKFGIDPVNMFEFWDWVGGRYSLWSAIGLSIATYIGFDNFQELLAGANDMDEHFKAAPLEHNIPVILALLDIWNTNFFGAETHAILPYDQYLHRLPAYLQQAFMESNGKSVDRNGNPVSYMTSPVIWGEAGTNGQHSFYQKIHQGGRIIPADFIGISNTQNPQGDHHEKLLANFLAQTKALAFGKSLQEVLGEGVNPAVAPHKVFNGNNPTNSILINKLSPRALGALIAMYEHQIFVEGVILNVYSFDQWGVELGKVQAAPILKDLKGEPTTVTHDSSTQSLLNQYKIQKASAHYNAQVPGVNWVPISDTELAIKRVFGTNGIRSDDIGEDGQRRIVAGTAEILAAQWKQAHPGEELPWVMVGFDPRPQGVNGFNPGEMGESKAVAETLAAYGFKVLFVPKAVAAPFMISVTGKNVHPKDIYAAVMRTASHNEVVDPKSGRLVSGVKLFLNNAPAADTLTGLISTRINNRELAAAAPRVAFDKAVADGRIVVVQEGDKNDPDTVEFNRLSRVFDLAKLGESFRAQYPNLKIAINTMNGGMSKFAVRVLTAMGFEEGKNFRAFNTTLMNDASMEAKMTGWIEYTDSATGQTKKVRFAPDPTRSWMRGKDYQDYVASNPANIIALLIDGDADRLVAELKKEIIPNDIGMLAAYYLAKYKGQTGRIMRTVPTTGGLDALAKALKLEDVQVTPVGSKWFAGPNKYYDGTLNDILVAVEESGHIGYIKEDNVSHKKELFFDHSIGLAVLMLEMMAETGKTWQELSDEMWAFIKEKTGQEKIAAVRYGISKDDGAERYYDLVARLGNPKEDAFRQKFGNKLEQGLATAGLPWKVSGFDITDSGGAQVQFEGGRKLFPRKSGTDGSVRLYVEVLETERGEAPKLVETMRKVMDSFVSSNPNTQVPAASKHTLLERAFDKAIKVVLLGNAEVPTYVARCGADKAMAIPHGFFNINSQAAVPKDLSVSVVGSVTTWSDMRWIGDVVGLIKEIRKRSSSTKALGYVAGKFVPYKNPDTGNTIDELNELRSSPDCIILEAEDIESAYQQAGGFTDLASFKAWLWERSGQGAKVIITEGEIKSKEVKNLQASLVDFNTQMYRELLNDFKPKVEYSGTLHENPGSFIPVVFESPSMADVVSEGIDMVTVHFGPDGKANFSEAAKRIVELTRNPAMYNELRARSLAAAQRLTMAEVASRYLEVARRVASKNAGEPIRIAIVTPISLKNYGEILSNGFYALKLKSENVTVDMLMPGNSEAMGAFVARVKDGHYDVNIVQLHGAHTEKPIAFEEFGNTKNILLVHRPEEVLAREKRNAYDIEELVTAAMAQDEITTAISLASKAGLQIPTHPNERYNLLVTSEFFANGELEEHRAKYGDRFDLDRVSGNSPGQFVDNILAKATGKETKTMALVPNDLPAGQLERLAKVGIRFVRVNAADLQKAKADKDTGREKFQVDTYAMMLLLRRIDNSITADSSIYQLLSFYLKSHFALADKVAVDDYIMAIVNNDVARLIKGCLSYRPAQPYEAPNYNNVAASLISA